ncbi:MAG: hypothetical protein HQK66_11525, partial [Desulfamplus sp.]|nr:hypothetical protein [Desulfamplus sp.]
MTVAILKTCNFYGYAVIQILIEPKRFFSELPDTTTFFKSLGFCLACGIFYSGAILLTTTSGTPFQTASIFFLNGVGMVFISSGLSYMAMVITLGKKVPFSRVFGVHGYS